MQLESKDLQLSTVCLVGGVAVGTQKGSWTWSERRVEFKTFGSVVFTGGCGSG